MSSAFSIQSLTLNDNSGSKVATPKEITFDIAYFPNGSGDSGAVIQNDKGGDIAGGAWPMENLLDASTSEANALRISLNLVEEIGCSLVILGPEEPVYFYLN